MSRRDDMAAETVELLAESMANMAGSEWSVHVLATRRKNGALTLKVHERSVEYGLRSRYRSGTLRTAGGFLEAWVQALVAGDLDPGRAIERLLLLQAKVLPMLERLHPMLARRLHADPSVRRAAAVLEARRRIGTTRGK